MALAEPPRTKNPDKVRGGQAAARARWGPEPRILRLDALDDDARRIVISVVRLAEAAAAAKPTAAKPTAPDTEPAA